MEDWHKLLTYLQNATNNIRKDVLENSDEVKAFGEMALLCNVLDLFLEQSQPDFLFKKETPP